MQESEYAAWVLVNGYALNHATIAVHKLKGPADLYELNDQLQQSGFELNCQGGVMKVSSDGLLRQSSTLADRRSYTFAGGETLQVPAAYIEFAERLVLPQFKHLRAKQYQEKHLRDGFEVASADKIFESTDLMG